MHPAALFEMVELADPEDPPCIPVADLYLLTPDRFGPTRAIWVEDGRPHHGHLPIEGRIQGDPQGFAITLSPHARRKYWRASLGLVPYLQLFVAAIQQRAREVGDIQFIGQDVMDEEYFCHYRLQVAALNAAVAWEHARAVQFTLESRAFRLAAVVEAQVHWIREELGASR